MHFYKTFNLPKIHVNPHKICYSDTRKEMTTLRPSFIQFRPRLNETCYACFCKHRLRILFQKFGHIGNVDQCTLGCIKQQLCENLITDVAQKIMKEKNIIVPQTCVLSSAYSFGIGFDGTEEQTVICEELEMVATTKAVCLLNLMVFVVVVNIEINV